MKEFDITEFPFELSWPYNVTTEKEDRRRFVWLEENVGNDNFFYNHGDYIDSPSLHFKHETDMLAYRLRFVDLPPDDNREYFDA